MKIAELIGDYERVSNFCEKVSVDKLIQKLKQLDEPERVKIPQFVAEFIEFAKKDDWNLRDVFLDVGCDDPFGSDVFNWLYQKRNNIDAFARAWLDGYEVEKEKRYLVKLKGVVCNSRVLRHNINEDTWFMSNEKNYTDLKSYHTCKELEEANFGWVFDCEGIEIEEVEE